MKINKGDKFLCIKDVVMKRSKEVAYSRGNVYISEQDGCITNNGEEEYHSWRGVEDVQSYFKPLRFVDKMYTEATDRLRELHRNFTGAKTGDPDEADQFDNKGIDHDDFAFSAQAGFGEIYKKAGYDYVSEEVFIELNGLEEKPNIKNYEDYIGKQVIGFKFDTRVTCGYSPLMGDYIGDVGTIVEWVSGLDVFEVEFEDGANWYYPADLVIKQLEQKEIYDEDPYSWVNNGIREAESRKGEQKELLTELSNSESYDDSVVFNPQAHYDNSKGSLYKVATDLNLNHWEFDIFKRLVRCRKKGQFKQDLQKIKDTIDIYIKEYDR